MRETPSQRFMRHMENQHFSVGAKKQQDKDREVQNFIETIRNETKQLSKKQTIELIEKYPDAPPPFGKVFDTEIPSAHAIYFLYNCENKIEYVGKANCLHLRLGTVLKKIQHHAIEDNDQISWIEFNDIILLEYIECYYIWKYRPIRNFKTKKTYGDMLQTAIES